MQTHTTKNSASIMLQIFALFSFLLRIADAQGRNSTSPALDAATPAYQRAFCQCSVDGFSDGTDVFYNQRTHSIYRSKNVVTGGPYQFIACGAHTRYYDRSEKQVAGYPWKFCYTYGGRHGCNITEQSRKHSLNRAIAYRFCNGDYDCQTQARTRVSSGTLVQSLLLAEVDEDGLLQDWTNCCAECRRFNGCKFWDFSVDTMTCQLYSDFDEVEREEDSNQPPYWYFGEPGFDDHPLDCWRRNRYDTCSSRTPRVLFSFGLFSLSASILMFACIFKGHDNKRVRRGSTDDVTPGYPRTCVRRVALPKGGSALRSVTTYSADVEYKAKSIVRRKHLVSTEYRFMAGKPLLFEYEEKDPASIKVAGKCFGCIYVFPCTLAVVGLMCIFFLSLQIIFTEGGQFAAKVVLPHSVSNTGWICVAVFVASSLVIVLLSFFLHLHKRRVIEDGDRFTRVEGEANLRSCSNRIEANKTDGVGMELDLNEKGSVTEHNESSSENQFSSAST